MKTAPKIVRLSIAVSLIAIAFYAPRESLAANELDWDLADEFRRQSAEIDQSTTNSVTRKDDGSNYCINILDDARETRNAVLTQRLTSLEEQVDKKLQVMSQRIAVLKGWVEQREAFLAKTNDSLVMIYQSMRPDAAASQLTEIGPRLSASIIAKLEPKYSSAILTEMKPADAAQITMALTNLMKTNDAR